MGMPSRRHRPRPKAGFSLTGKYGFTEAGDINIDALRDDFFQTETELVHQNDDFLIRRVCVERWFGV